MIIQHNLLSSNTARQYKVTQSRQAKASERLASGYKINRASDNAAGLNISEKMRSQIRGLDQAAMNAQDGISLIQTAEGAMAEIQNSLHRIRELYIQNCNDTNTTADREAIWEEASGLYSQINDTAHQTEFNEMKLLDGSYTVYAPFPSGPGLGKELNLQIGSGENQMMRFSIPNFATDNSNFYPGYDVFSPSITVGITSVNYSLRNYLGHNTAGAKSNFTDSYGTDSGGYPNQTMIFGGIDYALNKVSEARSNLGAINNRLEHVISNSQNTSENLQASESRIRDTDMADEMVEYSKNNILMQAGQSMLTQANQLPNQILSLLQ